MRSSDGIVLRTGQIMLTPNAVTLRMTNAGPDGRPLAVVASSSKEKKKQGDMVYPEPGSGPLFAYASAQKSGGMKIVQAPPRTASVAAVAPKGLMGYAPE